MTVISTLKHQVQYAMIAVGMSALMIAVHATGASAQAVAAGAYTPLAADWCLLDAPGMARQMKADGVTVCPAPQPVGATLPTELVIPLPCERAIVFRRIDIPAHAVLDQATAELGGVPDASNLRLRYAQGARTETISGGFTTNTEGALLRESYEGLTTRSYYMTAYELTDLQWAVFASGALTAWTEGVPGDVAAQDFCAPVRAMAKRTQTQRIEAKIRLGYFDALDFVRALNGYLMAENARRITLNRERGTAGEEPLSLASPWERGSPGFVRLPSEVEWEFAARGAVLNAASSLGQTHLVHDEADTTRMARLDEIANLLRPGARTARFTVGSRAPNLAGLYDTVGNAEEITHDLFRLVRPDGAHGAHGGYVLRGGGLFTPREVAGVSRRVEQPFYDAAGEVRPAQGGVRLALAAPVFVGGWSDDSAYDPNLRNVEFDAALARDHEALTSARSAPGAAFRAQARSLLDEIRAGDAAPADLAERLRAVEEALRASEAAINDAERDKRRATVTSGVATIHGIRLNGRLVYTMINEDRERRRNLECVFVETERAQRLERLDALVRQIDDMERQIAYQARYVQSLIATLLEADIAETDAAVAFVREGFRRDGLTSLDKAWDYFDMALAQKRAAPSMDMAAKFEAIFDDVASARAVLRSRPMPALNCEIYQRK